MHTYLRCCFRCNWYRNLAAVSYVEQFSPHAARCRWALHCNLYWNFISSSLQWNSILRLSCWLSIHQWNHLNLFFSSCLSTESRSTLPNLSLIMKFLGNFFTNFIFEKLLSHEALVTGRVTATSNNQTQLFK